MTTVMGVDGCKSNWVIIEKDLEAQQYQFHLWSTSELFLSIPLPQVMAIDLPIGLPDHGSRQCDIEARKRLGKRASSVFPAPIRPILGAATREEADAIRRKIDSKGVSHQTFGLLTKIYQVDKEIRQNPVLQSHIWEVHPEVCFYYLAGKSPMVCNKKTTQGFNERKDLLLKLYPRIIDQALNDLQHNAQKDDILDAFAALWTAERIAMDKFEIFPEFCPTDSCGLRMAIAV